MRVPSLTRHATGQGVVRIAGRDYYCGPYDSPEARKKYERLIAEYLGNKHSFSSLKDNLVAELAAAFLEYSKETYGESEHNNIRLAVTCLLELYGDLPGKDFGPRQFKTFRTQFQSGGKGNRSRQYINKCMRLIIRMFGWCTGEGMVEPNVVAVLREIPPLKIGRTDSPESKEIGEVSQTDVDATLPHLPRVVADMVRLQQLLGCRPGEICGIKPIMVDRSKDVWEIVLKRHKTASRGKSRCIYVGPSAQQLLQRYLDRDPDAYCFSPEEAMEQRRVAAAAKRTTPPNHGNRRGSRRSAKAIQFNKSYTTSSYGHAIKYACKLAWPPPAELSKAEQAMWRRNHSWSPNQLRHSAGAQIREAFGLEHVAAVLGHSDVDTSKIYAKLRREQAIEAAMTR